MRARVSRSIVTVVELLELPCIIDFASCRCIPLWIQNRLSPKTSTRRSYSSFLFCRVLLPPPVQATNNYTLAPATEQSFSSVCLTLITTTQMGRAGEMCKWPADEKQPINNNAGMELKNKRDGRLADAAGVNTSPSSSQFSVRPR